MFNNFLPHGGLGMLDSHVLLGSYEGNKFRGVYRG